MRTRLLMIFLLLLIPCWSEAEERKADSFAVFWRGFKSAVAADDKEAVVAATDLRFFHQNKHLSAKADFLRQYGSIFDKKVKKCFARAKPVKEDDRDTYYVFCGEEIYSFEKLNGEYKFTSIGPND